MKNPIVSIIVPVYNTEKYIGKCLDSLLSQTLINIEIICINDGSTDNSLKVLREYEKKDQRVIVIDQKNCGSAAARNAGLKHAQGLFIGFIDSDDYAENNMYDVLVAEAHKNKADVVICGANLFPESPHAPQWLYDSLTPSRKLFEKYEPKMCFSMADTDNFLWRTLIKKQILEENHILFNEELSLGEDKVFLCSVYPKAHKISVIPDKLYNYCWHRENSLMNTLAYANNTKKLDKHCLLIDRLSNIIGKRKIEGEEQEFLQWVIPFLYGDFIYQSRNDKIFFSKRIIDSLAQINISYTLLKLPPYMVEDYNYIEKHKDLHLEDNVLCSVIMYVDENSRYTQNIVRQLKKIIGPEFEIIIINNGMMGENYVYIKNWLEREANLRLYNTPEHMKRYEALNKGISLANGNYIIFLDTHDRTLNSKKLLDGIKKAWQNNADICIFKEKATSSCYGSEHKNIAYKTKWIHEKNLFIDHDSILYGKIFVENVLLNKPNIINFQNKIVETEQESNIEYFGGIEGGAYIHAIKKLVDLAKKTLNYELYGYAYKLLNSDLSRNILKNELYPNRDYYIDENKTSNQITIIEDLFELVTEFDLSMLKEDMYISENYMEILIYLINERQNMLNKG